MEGPVVGRMVGQASCWVLRKQARAAVVVVGVFSQVPGIIVGPRVCGLGWWVGCVLRIAQWTRASLWSSCQGRTVDALAPGADEGRGRPR